MTKLHSVCHLLGRSAFLIVSRGAQQYLAPAAAPALKISCSWLDHASVTHALWPQQQSLYFSSQAGGSSNSSSSSSSSPGSEAVVDQLSSMMEVMMQNPAMEQMLLSRLPPHMRKREVLQAMMANPEVRQRIAAIAQQSGLAHMFSGLDPSKMAAGLQASHQAGLDAAQLMERLQQSPTLAARMNNPRVLAALMDMASNGPDALKNYSGDKDVVEAAMEAGDIIQQLQQEQQAGSSSESNSSSPASSSSSSNGMAAVEAQLGGSPQDLMQRLMQRPELLAKFQDPKVQAALQEVSQSPWKIVKYLFNKDVMSAIKEMKDMVQPPPAAK